MDYGPDDWGSIPAEGKSSFSMPQRSDRLWGPHSLLSNGNEGSFPGVKRQGCEADHLSPSVAKVQLILTLPNMSSWLGV
jgi:hypothetical protein